jgi:hypothetical protein
VTLISKYNFSVLPHLKVKKQDAYLEDDQILTADQKNGIAGSTYIWPEGIIPYTFEGNFCS